jgi:hypothetical protein
VLTGSADVARLAERAGIIDVWATEPVRLENVETLTLVYEIESAGAEDLLPPALHPTIPPIAAWTFHRAASSAAGPFTLAELRIGCRFGVRPRGFLAGSFVDREGAASLLAAHGYRAAVAEVRLQRFYDEVVGTVALDRRPLVSALLLDPDPLSPSDVQQTATVVLARTPRGVRLVQVEPELTIHRAERGRPRLDHFDALAWGADGVRPAYAVSASTTVSDVTVPPIRYAAKPDVLAFEGTETVP